MTQKLKRGDRCIVARPQAFTTLRLTPQPTRWGNGWLYLNNLYTHTEMQRDSATVLASGTRQPP